MDGFRPEHDEKGNLITRELPDKKPHLRALLKLLDSCKALVKKANKAEAAWEKNPESAEKENAFNEAYEWQGHELQGSIPAH